MTHGIHVTSLTAHQITGAVVIVKGKILMQEFPVNSIPHVKKDTLTGAFKKHLSKVLETLTENTHSKKNGNTFP
jgi:hypothetical protein